MEEDIDIKMMETPDTQIINLDFKNGTSMSWESRSCNGKHSEGSSVGVVFYGENGSLKIPGGNSYKIYDLKNNIIQEEKFDQKIDPRNTVNLPVFRFFTYSKYVSSDFE